MDYAVHGILQATAGDIRELPRVSLRVDGYCGVGGASRDSAGFVAMEKTELPMQVAWVPPWSGSYRGKDGH